MSLYTVTYGLDNEEEFVGNFKHETFAVNKFTTAAEKSAEEFRQFEKLDVQVEVRHKTGEVLIVIVDQADKEELEWYRITETEVQ